MQLARNTGLTSGTESSPRQQLAAAGIMPDEILAAYSPFKDMVMGIDAAFKREHDAKVKARRTSVLPLSLIHI